MYLTKLKSICAAAAIAIAPLTAGAATLDTVTVADTPFAIANGSLTFQTDDGELSNLNGFLPVGSLGALVVAPLDVDPFTGIAIGGFTSPDALLAATFVESRINGDGTSLTALFEVTGGDNASFFMDFIVAELTPAADTIPATGGGTFESASGIFFQASLTPTAAIPLPAGGVLLLTGLAGLGVARRSARN